MSVIPLCRVRSTSDKAIKRAKLENKQRKSCQCHIDGFSNEATVSVRSHTCNNKDIRR